MGKRHFTERGYPKWEVIINDICDFVDGIKLEIIEPPFTAAMRDPFDPKDSQLYHLDLGPAKKRLLPWRMNVDPQVTGLDFRNTDYFQVANLYVVGSQARSLAEGSYNYGRDLDLVVRLNVPTLEEHPRKQLYYPIDFVLPKHLNGDLKFQSTWNRKADPEYGFSVGSFVIGSFDGLTPGNPYIELYPNFRIPPKKPANFI